ncbi:hypothetical protein [Amycolatopsis panacis]|uniref:hypothetical protein n=1 Tax=Amycolatopsis panacis TaxID=2340917 RepID=UPI001F4149E9|nr:hypothetical protein [Amycolatopsis panacis]
MDHERLFAAIRPMLRKGGGVAVVTNGLPLWSQESPWSRALDEVLAGWFDRPLTVTCGTDEISQTRYGESLAAAGYAVDNGVIEYRSELTLDQIVGGVYSALSEDSLPAHQDRATFADRIRMAIEPHAPYVEPVSVKIVTGRC